MNNYSCCGKPLADQRAACELRDRMYAEAGGRSEQLIVFVCYELHWHVGVEWTT